MDGAVNGGERAADPRSDGAVRQTLGLEFAAGGGCYLALAPGLERSEGHTDIPAMTMDYAPEEASLGDDLADAVTLGAKSADSGDRLV
jgi:hypothetical protein